MTRHSPIWLLGLACCGAAASAAHALTVERVAGSLGGRPTVFTRVADAPHTEWRRAGPDSRLDSRTPPSTFASKPAPDTVFRVAEVPPERVTVTRELLGALQARQTEQKAIVIDLPADVLFDFDKATLRADAQTSLDQAAELLRSYPDAPLAINGHTDGKGSEAYNDALSTRRAQAVADRLGAATGARSFAVRGHGKRQPLVPDTHADGSDDPDARQRNRRVEIVIQPAGVAGSRSAEKS